MRAVDTRPMSILRPEADDGRAHTEETWIPEERSGALPPVDGHYAIGQPLGASPGEVYAATHSHFPGEFAIKRLQTPRLFDAAAVRTFEMDVERTRRLDHPHIVHALDLGADADTAFLVMERLDGLSMSEWLSGKPAPKLRPSEALSLLRQIAFALAAAHGVGVNHRRLRPDNVFLARALGYPIGFVKLLDFGLSNVQPRPGADPALDIEQARYLAPEQAEGAPGDEASDQFSLAAIAYRLLSGRPAFVAPDIASTLAEVAAAEPASLSRIGVCDVRTDAVVRKALSRDPRLRFASVIEFAQALVSAVDPTDKERVVLESGSQARAAADRAAALPAPEPGDAMHGRRDSLGTRFFEEGERKEAGQWSAAELAGEDAPDPEAKGFDSYDKVPTRGRSIRILMALTLLVALAAALTWYFSRVPTTQWSSWSRSRSVPTPAALPPPDEPAPAVERAMPAAAPQPAATESVPEPAAAIEPPSKPRMAIEETPPLRGYVWSPREKRLVPAAGQ